jgi:hypothetical protein
MPSLDFTINLIIFGLVGLDFVYLAVVDLDYLGYFDLAVVAVDLDFDLAVVVPLVDLDFVAVLLPST